MNTGPTFNPLNTFVALRQCVFVCAFSIFLLGICGHASNAYAQAKNYAEAKAKAKTAYRSGDYAGAAKLFKQAFDFSPRGNLLYNVGLCYEKAGAVTEAIKFYQRFIDAVPIPAVARPYKIKSVS